jgi:hypothetical protein
MAWQHPYTYAGPLEPGGREENAPLPPQISEIEAKPSPSKGF